MKSYSENWAKRLHPIKVETKEPDKDLKISEKIIVKYVFNQDEISEKGIQLGRLHQNVEQIKDEIKEFVSMKKSQIEQSNLLLVYYFLNTQINELSRHVTNGYTYVDELCRVRLMDPIPGQKSYYRMDNGDFVETRPMQPMDYQSRMQFEAQLQAETSPAGSGDE